MRRNKRLHGLQWFTRSPRRRGRAPKCRGRLSLPGLDRRGGV